MPVRSPPSFRTGLLAWRDLLPPLPHSPPFHPSPAFVPAAASSGRGFHAGRVLRNDASSASGSGSGEDHYETLNVALDASPAEIKKSFYTLSKTHHPDHNPTDPHAGRRFMRISEAYAVLGHAEKRAKYDRDVMRHRRPHHHPHIHARPHGGSYHSSSSSTTGPAGGRPASGLSRRRGTFQGPPPSFFRSGGWGAQGAKRAAAHADSTGTGSAGAGDGSGTMGGMGPGQHPFGHRGEPGPGHFDRVAHERTHRRADERRAATAAARRAAAAAAAAAGGADIGDADADADADRAVHREPGAAVGFFTVAGLLFVGTMLPYVLFGGWWRPAPPPPPPPPSSHTRASDERGSSSRADSSRKQRGKRKEASVTGSSSNGDASSASGAR